jgi:UDP-N-acetylmuramate dehydrogenase
MSSLSEYTTFHLGGSAKTFITATTEAEIISAITEADLAGERVLILGGGSNLLISDQGFDGTVIHIATKGNSYEIDACSGGMLEVQAGEDWDSFVHFCMELGLANLESLSGIPGTVGASPIQNIGAYGHEVGEVIARVRTFDRQDRIVKTLTASECGFGYRTSRFKQEPERFIILSVTFQLRRGEKSLPIAYAELAKQLGVEVGARVEIERVREAVLALRAAKGMLVSEGIWSAGSFFTNPILEPAVAALLPADAPRWVQEDGRVKSSAAWLIEQSGIEKGFTHKGAQISPRHVLALSNSGAARTQDVLELMELVIEKVEAKFGIRLDPEVQIIR